MKQTSIAFALSTLILTGCSTISSSNVETKTDVTTNMTKPVVKAAAPIQTELVAEEPVLKSGPNLYNLGPWINSEPIGSLEDLRGNVVLVKFWTFGCVNCIHTLPHVQKWHEKYEDQGLKILGIHSPEFAQPEFKKSSEPIETALEPTAPITLETEAEVTVETTVVETPASLPQIPHSAEEIEAMSEAEKIEAEAELLQAFEAVPDIMIEEAMPEPEAPSFQPTTISTGSFKDADRSHKGSGQVKIITQEDGSHLLRLENFSVTNGPDLYVSLAENADPKKGRDVKAGYIALERLKANKGSQNYTIAAGTDLSKYKSVVIYCQAYSVVFSVATLQ